MISNSALSPEWAVLLVTLRVGVRDTPADRGVAGMPVESTNKWWGRFCRSQSRSRRIRWH